VSTEDQPIVVKRGKFSPEVEAQDLMAGDWDSLAELETHAAEIIGESFDEGFRKGATSEREAIGAEMLAKAGIATSTASTPPGKAAKPAPKPAKRKGKR